MACALSPRSAVVVGALALVACAPAALRPRPRVVVLHARAPAPAPPPSLEERLSRARAELEEGALVAEESERLDGEARLHLVLQHGRCYRVWVGAEVPFEARLEDEHGHVVAEASGEPAWLDEVCPRFSGSFALVIGSSSGTATMAVLVAQRSR